MKIPKFNPLDLIGHATKIDPTLPTIKVEPTLPTSKADVDLPTKVDATATANVDHKTTTPLITSVPLSSRDTNDEDGMTPVKSSARLTTDDDEDSTTSRKTATSDDDDSPRPTRSSDDEEPTSTTKSKSSTPTIDSLIPTTMVTKTSSSSSWDYPYPSTAGKLSPTSTSIPKNSTTSELDKLKASLHTYKTHYRNMIIALTCFALLVIGYIAFRIWWYKYRVAGKGVKTVLEGGRGWFGAMKKGKEYYEMRKAKKNAKGSAPGGADYI